MVEWTTVDKTVTSKLIVGLSIDIKDTDPQVVAKKKANREGQKKATGYTNDSFKECVQLFLDQISLVGAAHK